MNHWPTKGIPTRNLNARAGDYKCPSPMKLIEQDKTSEYESKGIITLMFLNWISLDFCFN